MQDSQTDNAVRVLVHMIHSLVLITTSSSLRAMGQVPLQTPPVASTTQQVDLMLFTNQVPSSKMQKLCRVASQLIHLSWTLTNVRSATTLPFIWLALNFPKSKGLPRWISTRPLNRFPSQLHLDSKPFPISFLSNPLSPHVPPMFYLQTKCNTTQLRSSTLLHQFSILPLRPRSSPPPPLQLQMFLASIGGSKFRYR